MVIVAMFSRNKFFISKPRNSRFLPRKKASGLLVRYLCGASLSSTDEPSKSPSITPRVLIDIKHIRENAALHKQNCLDRNYKRQAEYPAQILSLTQEWQTCQTSSRAMRERNNYLTRQLAPKGSQTNADEVEKDKPTRQDLLTEARSLKKKLSEINAEQSALDAKICHLAMEMPNLTSQETPRGVSPKEICYLNEKLEPKIDAQAENWPSHIEIGQELKLLDFTNAAKTSGWGWYYLMNEAVCLEQALVQYALNLARRYGWTLVSPPSLVYSHIADSCGFQPRDHNGEQQIYQIQQNAADTGRKPQMSLTGTAEIPLAGMKANQTLEENDLPLKYVGVSRCYRAEAGARGVKTKGLYRVHEFTKVEMFAFTKPNSVESSLIFEEMHMMQREVLTNLHLYCRVLEMPSSDLGASATRKRDIEAYFPSRRNQDCGWGEVTSLSNCTDYQTRRLGTRLRLHQSGQDDQLLFPHTLNGTLLAVPRVLAALLETMWDPRKGVVELPEVLWPYSSGIQKIGRIKS